MANRHIICFFWTALTFLTLSLSNPYVAEATSGDDPNQPNYQSDRKSNNAAFYYSRAFELLKFPESGELKSEVYAIVQNGWRQEHREAEKLLQENAVCLLEFKKGTELTHCDFDFGRKIPYLAEKDYPSPIAYTLFTVIELQTRYHEKHERFETAVGLYLASLAYAQHLSRDNTAQSKLMGYIIGHEAVKRLKSYLNNNQFQTRQCPKIIAHLNAHDISSALKEIHEAERDWVKSIIKKTADTFMISVTEKFRDQPEIIGKAVQFRQEYMARAYEDIDYYYGNFIKAAQTRKKQDWEFANAEAGKFKKF